MRQARTQALQCILTVSSVTCAVVFGAVFQPAAELGLKLLPCPRSGADLLEVTPLPGTHLESMPSTRTQACSPNLGGNRDTISAQLSQYLKPVYLLSRSIWRAEVSPPPHPLLTLGLLKYLPLGSHVGASGKHNLDQLFLVIWAEIEGGGGSPEGPPRQRFRRPGGHVYTSPASVSSETTTQWALPPPEKPNELGVTAPCPSEPWRNPCVCVSCFGNREKLIHSINICRETLCCPDSSGDRGGQEHVKRQKKKQKEKKQAECSAGSELGRRQWAGDKTAEGAPDPRE